MSIVDALMRRGASYAPPPPAHSRAQLRAVEGARRQWLNALLVDQTRAWMDLGQQQSEVLRGLCTLLALASFVQAHDLGTEDTPDQRVIRGAMSAAANCGESGCVISVADARAFDVACDRAKAIITAGTVPAIINASFKARELVSLPNAI